MWIKGNRIAESGFTLIEAVFSIVLLGIVAVTAGLLVYQAARSFETLDNTKEVSMQGTLALERMERELRQIRCTAAGNSCVASASDITAMTATEIRFVTEGLEGRGFRLDATDLKLRQGSTALDPEDILASGVSSLSFEYLKSDGSTASAVNEAWLINISMTLTQGSQTLDLKAAVHPRVFR